jgi:hypothetical protein
MTIEPYYQFSNNYITQTGKLINDTIFEYKYSNAGNYKHYGAQARIYIPIGKNLSFKTTCDFFRSSIDYNGNNNTINDWTLYSWITYRIKKSHTEFVFRFYRFNYKEIIAQGYYAVGDDIWAMYVQEPFFKQKLIVRLVYMLPITLGVENNHNSNTYTNAYNEYYCNYYKLQNMLRFNITFRFNEGKSVNIKEKNVEKDNVKSVKGF